MPRTGRPKGENPIEKHLGVRLDADTFEKLDECVEILKSNRSAIVRRGVKELHEKLNKNVDK